MKRNVCDVRKNCNYCELRQIMSKHWDLEDRCLFNKKVTSKINMEMDCPLYKWEAINIEKRGIV